MKSQTSHVIMVITMMIVAVVLAGQGRFEYCVFESEIPRGYSLKSDYGFCNESSTGALVYIDAIVYSSIKSVRTGDSFLREMVAEEVRIRDLPAFIYQSGGTPSARLLNATRALGMIYMINSTGLYLNNTLLISSGSRTGDVFAGFDGSSEAMQNSTVGTTPTAPPPQNTTGADCNITGFCGWSTTFSKVPGSCPKSICPPWMSESPFLEQRHWGLCGGCKTIFQSLCGRAVHWEGCKAGSGCGLPRYPKSCEKVSGCVTDSAGCFDGYSSSSECLVRTGADNCYQVPSEASVPMSNCEYFTNPKWCPVGNPIVDPVVCYNDNQLSFQCMRNFYSGIPVQGTRSFCLQNVCSPSSYCHCYYSELKFNTTSTDRLYKVRRASLKGIEMHGKGLVPREPAGLSQCQTSFSQKEKKLIVVCDGYLPVSVILSKTTKRSASVCEERVCMIRVPDEFYDTTGMVYVEITSLGNSVKETSFPIIAIVKCDKYIDNWDELFDTDCMTSQQVGLMVTTIVLLCLCLLALMILLFSLMVFLAKWAHERRMRGEAEMRSSGSSQLLEDIRAWLRSGSRYIYHSGLIMILISGVASQNCEVTMSGSSVADLCIFEDCGPYHIYSLNFNAIGSSACFSTNGTNYHITLVDQPNYARYGTPYYAAEYEVIQEQGKNCNYLDHCSQEKCAKVSAENDRTAQGQLATQWTKSRPGVTSCDLICRSNSVGQDLIDCGCLLTKNNCLWCSASINPMGEVFKVEPVTRLDRQSEMMISENGLKTKFTGNYYNGNVKVKCSETGQSTSKELEGYCYTVKSGKQHLEKCSPRGEPIMGRLGEIQSPYLSGMESPESDSFVFDPKIIGDRSFSPEGCLWSQPGLHRFSEPLPRVIDGLFWEPSEVGPVTRSAQISTTICTVYSKRDLGMLEVTGSCPRVFEHSDLEGCGNCDQMPGFSASLGSTCTAGQASVSCSSCTFLSPSFVSLNNTPEAFMFKMTPGDSRLEIEVCFSGVTKECIVIKNNLWVSDDDFARSNSTIVPVDSDHRNDSWYNPFSWMQNIVNGLGEWWEWLLMVIFWIILIVVAVLVFWFSWPIIVGAYQCAVNRSRRAAVVETSYQQADIVDDPGDQADPFDGVEMDMISLSDKNGFI